jgi:hypothetical protein
LFLRHFLARPMVQGPEIDLKLKERFGPDRAVVLKVWYTGYIPAARVR